MYESQQSYALHANVTGVFVKLFDSPVALTIVGVADRSKSQPSGVFGGGQGCGVYPVAEEGATKHE